MHRPVSAALSAALLLTVLAGCSSGPDLPEESDFAAGTCRTAAPDVRAVGEALPELGDGPKVAADVQDALREAQDRIDALASGAEPDLKPALTDLVQKIGIVRIRAAGNSYDPELGEFLATSYEKVLDVCTGDAAAG